MPSGRVAARSLKRFAGAPCLPSAAAASVRPLQTRLAAGRPVTRVERGHSTHWAPARLRCPKSHRIPRNPALFPLLVVVREEMSQLAAEERALTAALSSLDGDGASLSTTARTANADDRSRTPQSSARSSSTRKAGTSGRRRRRGATKSTADRVNELQALLADGPKSRNELAAALKVSPARVQQLLVELGKRSVSSQRDPEQRQEKLWALSGRGNGPRPQAGAASAAAERRRQRRLASRQLVASKQRSSNASGRSPLGGLSGSNCT